MSGRPFILLVSALLLAPAIAVADGIIRSGTAHRAEIEACGRRLEALMSVQGPRALWTSNQLHDRPVATEARGREIVRLAMHDPALRAELEAFVGSLQNENNQSRALWNLYFRVYDHFVAFSNGYRSLIAAANSALPQRGTIADLGSGTGNFSAVLLAGAPERRIVAIENSDLGVQLTEEKLARVANGKGRYEVRQQSLLDAGTLAPNSLDGAVMNNVLYTFNAADQRTVLGNILRALRPGARLVFNDPTLLLNQSDRNVYSFLSSISESAVRNGTSGSEFDLALFTYLNHRNLVANSSFQTPQQLVELARSAGFIVREVRTGAYYTGGTVLVLERP